LSFLSPVAFPPGERLQETAVACKMGIVSFGKFIVCGCDLRKSGKFFTYSFSINWPLYMWEMDSEDLDNGDPLYMHIHTKFVTLKCFIPVLEYIFDARH
jgi:hypothetical protein